MLGHRACLDCGGAVSKNVKRCRPCAGLLRWSKIPKIAQRIEVTCKGCNKKWDKRKDSIKEWSGLCHACACKEVRRRNPSPKRVSLRWRTEPITAPCKDCGRVLTFKNPGVVRRWGGRCKHCSGIEVAGRPEIKERTRAANKAIIKPRGPLNPSWRGGPKNRAGQCHTADYKDWRKAVFTRDSYTCVLCGQRGGQLNADHIKPVCAYPELIHDISNGRTLCVTCHRKTDTWGGKAQRFKQTA